MITFEKPVKCKDYSPMDTDKLLFWMNNSHVFYYSCENCINCGKCGKKIDKN